MATATEAQAQIEGFANTRFVRVSPQKARLVIDLIRGKRAEDAIQTLRFTKKRVAKEVEKTLRSAIANAERKAEDSGESLDVEAAEHHRAAADRAAAAVAEEQASKGVKGAVRKARKALEKRTKQQPKRK